MARRQLAAGPTRQPIAATLGGLRPSGYPQHMPLTSEGGRVLGCLVEKQLTTPQLYPLTMNGLLLACNQATNRDPVMILDETAVQQALQELKELRWVRFVLPSHGKSVTRYRHVFDEAYGLDTAGVALLAVLLLRGPQTPGELRVRTARMAEFTSIDALQNELEGLTQQPEPLVRLLPRQPGQKEDRWQQLLAVESATAIEPGGAGSMPQTDPGNSGPRRSPDDASSPDAQSLTTHDPSHQGDLQRRVELLESEVLKLRGQIGELSVALSDLRNRLGE